VCRSSGNRAASVGATGAERQITNLAAGRISATSTDAINGSQLYATNSAIENLSTTVAAIDFPIRSSNGKPYTTTATGTDALAVGANAQATADNTTAVGENAVATNTNETSIGGTAGTVTAAGNVNNTSVGAGSGNGTSGLANTALGVRSGQNIAGDRNTSIGIDAGSGTVGQGNLAMGTLSGQGTTGSGNVAIGELANASSAGGAIVADNTVAIGNSSRAQANRALALGAGAVASNIGDVALGAGSVTAAANPTSSATVNGVTYGGFAGAAPTSVASVGSVGGERQVTNVAAGRVSATSTDAINGSQLYSVANELTSTVAASKTRYYSVQGTSTGAGSNADNDGATGLQAMAAGESASAAGVGSTALGNASKATADGGVALGSGSVSDRAVAGTQGTLGAGTNFTVPYNTTDKTLLGAVSVGSATSYRQITNVADGTEQQDAVTVRQLTGALQSFAVSPTKYFHANSSAADSLAGGAESVAIGPQTVVNADNGIGVGNGATVQQSAIGGVAIGAGSSVTLLAFTRPAATLVTVRGAAAVPTLTVEVGAVPAKL
jgi:autotransporter adhesin